MTGIQLAGTNATVSFTTVSNRSLSVESTTNLTGNSWSAVTNNLTGTGSEQQVTDSGGANGTKRFYRARIVP